MKGGIFLLQDIMTVHFKLMLDLYQSVQAEPHKAGRACGIEEWTQLPPGPRPASQGRLPLHWMFLDCERKGL